MDEIEHGPLAKIPLQALSLRLARSPIRMSHAPSWRTDKVNPVHDLVMCLTGTGHYTLDGEEITVTPGDTLLIPAYSRFRGRHGGSTDLYTGVAQHFSLDLFGRGDVIGQMHLKKHTQLSNWQVFEPLVHHYRNTSPTTSTTLAQHHQFMVLLLAHLDSAFIDWRMDDAEPESRDQLSIQIMFVASRLSSDPLGSGVEEAMRSVSYNPDYFRRAFRDRMGMTPGKYRELKRMEFAVNRLAQGLSVKEVAAELGYTDPYFFSRMFKRHIGASPSSYRLKRSGLVDKDDPKD